MRKVCLCVLFTLCVAVFSFPACDTKKDDNNSQLILIGMGLFHSAGDIERFNTDHSPFFMVYVPGGITFPTGIDDNGDIDADAGQDIDPTATVVKPYWIGQREVEYELWYDVYTWATHADRGANIYAFANPGREGDNGIDGNSPTSEVMEPVTYVNWRDAMVWCNALTEWYNAHAGANFRCVYTSDSGYKSPIRDSSDGIYGASIDSNTGSFDNPYVNPRARGFRLLTTSEWGLAARYIDDINNDGDIADAGEYYPGDFPSGSDADYNDTTGASDYDGDADVDYLDDVAVWDGNSGSTHNVANKRPNALGLCDMSGNVWELCYDWHPYHINQSRVRRGGGYNDINSAQRLGNWHYITPYGEDDSLGFRIARKP